MQVLDFFILSLLNNNEIPFSITSIVMNTFHPPITTGIVSHSVERQTFLLPKINMVSLSSPYISFNFPKFKDHKKTDKQSVTAD